MRDSLKVKFTGLSPSLETERNAFCLLNRMLNATDRAHKYLTITLKILIEPYGSRGTLSEKTISPAFDSRCRYSRGKLARSNVDWH